MTAAIESLSDLVTKGYEPGKLDEYHDLLKLLGIVIAQATLLDVASNSLVDAKDRVSASRTLLNFAKETPEAIAERLRRSPFADLNIDQLHAIVQQVKAGKSDIHAIIQEVKENNGHL